MRTTRVGHAHVRYVRLYLVAIDLPNEWSVAVLLHCIDFPCQEIHPVVLHMDAFFEEFQQSLLNRDRSSGKIQMNARHVFQVLNDFGSTAPVFAAAATEWAGQHLLGTFVVEMLLNLERTARMNRTSRSTIVFT